MARPHTRDALEPTIDDPIALREHRKQRLALGYQLFGALRWGGLGDGHISARDPVLLDHYWLARYGVPFAKVTVDDLVLVRPDGKTVDGDDSTINPAAHCIHWPIHEARPEIVCAAHTHTPYGTPFAALVRQVEAISQESCAFFEDHAIFDDEELDVVSVDGGKRIADALGSCKVVTLRNHGHLTVGGTIDEAVGWYVMFERVAEVHVKCGADAKAISLEGARRVARSVGNPADGWHAFQWLISTYL
jgi:ribulose-5-phosphate 4-epimerase/fuculose-1-phosphate aldolase